MFVVTVAGLCHSIPRVSGCLSLRPNWLPPPPLRVCPPLLGTKGGRGQPERGGSYWLLKLRWMVTHRVQIGLVGWFVGLVMPVQETFILPWLLWSAQFKKNFPHRTLCPFMCPYCPVTWEGSRAGPSFSECVSLGAGEGGGRSQFRRLERKPGTLSTLLNLKNTIHWRFHPPRTLTPTPPPPLPHFRLVSSVLLELFQQSLLYI